MGVVVEEADILFPFGRLASGDGNKKASRMPRGFSGHNSAIGFRLLNGPGWGKGKRRVGDYEGQGTDGGAGGMV